MEQMSGLTRLRHDDVCLLIQDPVMDEISPMVIRWELVALASGTSLNRVVSLGCIMTLDKFELGAVTRWNHDA